MTGICKWRDLFDILFWLIMLIAGLLSTYKSIGRSVGNVMELLVRKCENEINFFTVLKTAFNSASVESAAMNDWILVVQEIITPLRKLLFDCMDLRSGSILPKAESEKYTIEDGKEYCCVYVWEYL